ncbi:hypothetical protein LCGC14_2903040 [marine sediment metagenome]|uniref:Uncharacterized protein n=1 Tax=marine sediment metagenome TaxID=412755 RepID=A0A0F8YFR9_9ZZZZ
MHYSGYEVPGCQPDPMCGARNVPPERLTDDPKLVTCGSSCDLWASQQLVGRKYNASIAARESHGSGVRTPEGYDCALLEDSPAGPLGVEGLRALANALWSAQATLEMREQLREEGP